MIQEVFYISYEDALAAHRQAVGIAGADQVRDSDLLESILTRPRQLAGHASADIVAQAAALMRGIVMRRPWRRGNKRAAIQLTFTFLLLNGYEVDAAEDDVLALATSLAEDSAQLSERDVATWLRSHVTP